MFRLAAASALVVVLAACGATGPSGPSATFGPGATVSLAPPDQGTPVASGNAGSGEPSPALTSPVRGVVLHVDLAGLGKVTGFRLLTTDGQQVDFTMGVQDNAAEFPAAHLSEHMASAQPVLVSFHQQGSALVVYHIEDATPDASGSAAPASPSGS